MGRSVPLPREYAPIEVATMKHSVSRAALVLVTTLLVAVGCRAQAPAAAPASPQALREEFRKTVLGSRTPTPLNPQTVSQNTLGKVKVEKVRFTPEKGQDAVAVIYRPVAEGKHPTVIVQHFLGGSKDHIAFIPLMNTLAQRGYVVAAIDARYRGERQNGKTLEAAMLEALRGGQERPFLFDTAYDLLRLIDYLETRPDVDPQRIGMTGFSEGGILTWMCAALDDRIRVAVPIIGVTSFAQAFEDGPSLNEKVRLFEPVLREHARDLGEKEINGKVLRSAWQKLVPGMLDRFDAPNLLPLIAPRPLLILNHEQDELFPVEGARRCFAVCQARYKELKAEGRLELRVAPGLKHAAFNFGEVTSMMDWMDRWLKPGAMAAADK
ncbi:MAG: alpha/beta hydrolase family protein [Armatimonadota bacterium]